MWNLKIQFAWDLQKKRIWKHLFPHLSISWKKTKGGKIQLVSLWKSKRKRGKWSRASLVIDGSSHLKQSEWGRSSKDLNVLHCSKLSELTFVSTCVAQKRNCSTYIARKVTNKVWSAIISLGKWYRLTVWGPAADCLTAPRILTLWNYTYGDSRRDSCWLRWSSASSQQNDLLWRKAKWLIFPPCRS